MATINFANVDVNKTPTIVTGVTTFTSKVTVAELETSRAATEEGSFSVISTGTSPNRICSLQSYDGGALKTLAQVTY